MHCRLGMNLGFTPDQLPQFHNILGSTDAVENLRYGAELGFVGAEDVFLVARPPEAQSAIGKAMGSLGMSLGPAAVGGLTPFIPLWGRSDADSRAEVSRRVREAIEATSRGGGRELLVNTGCEDGIDREAQLQALIDNLRRVVPDLERAGMRICLEPVSPARWPGLLLGDLDDAVRVADAVDSDHVGVVFDTLHIQLIHGDVSDTLRRAQRRLASIQLADTPDRKEPGSGEIDFVAFIRAARDLGYGGVFCLEHHNSIPGADGERQALEMLRAIDAAAAA